MRAAGECAASVHFVTEKVAVDAFAGQICDLTEFCFAQHVLGERSRVMRVLVWNVTLQLSQLLELVESKQKPFLTT